MSFELTVIIPSYNTADFIGDAIFSIVQDVPEAEIIIVDDGSNDNTIENIYRFRLKNIRVIELKKTSPGGAGYPSNVGLEAATGEYISFIDSDDFFYTGYLSGMLKQIKNTKTDICVSGYMLVDTFTHVTKPAYDHINWMRITKGKEKGYFSKEQYFTLSPEPWRKIYNSNIFTNRNVRFPVNGWFNEDYPFHWFAGLESKQGISFVNNNSYFHRIKRSGQTTSAMDKRLFFLFDHTNEILQHMKIKPEYSQYYGFLLNWLLLGAWKLKQLNTDIDEYYTKYKKLILSFDAIATNQFIKNADPETKHYYRAIVLSKNVSELYNILKWDNLNG
jgi:glycosyltransferase involved in cell wall biosynthesis